MVHRFRYVTLSNKEKQFCSCFICHRLKHIYTSSYGIDNIMMRNLKCTGTENDLRRCSYSAPGSNYCSGAVNLDCDDRISEYRHSEVQYVRKTCVNEHRRYRYEVI